MSSLREKIAAARAARHSRSSALGLSTTPTDRPASTADTEVCIHRLKCRVDLQSLRSDFCSPPSSGLDRFRHGCLHIPPFIESSPRLHPPTSQCSCHMRSLSTHTPPPPNVFLPSVDIVTRTIAFSTFVLCRCLTPTTTQVSPGKLAAMREFRRQQDATDNSQLVRTCTYDHKYTAPNHCRLGLCSMHVSLQHVIPSTLFLSVPGWLITLFVAAPTAGHATQTDATDRGRQRV